MNLSNSLNWNIAYRSTAIGRKLPDGRYSYKRIRFSAPETTKFIVAVGSRDAKQTWRYGGIARFLLPGSPSSTSQFGAGIVIKEISLSIGILTLVDLGEYDKAQYSIELVPPSWFPSYSYEAWWYDGPETGIIKKIDDLHQIL